MKTHIGRTAHLPRRQRGVILLIALIVLVAMTLVAIGTMRSTDTGTVVAGNLAFKQTTLSATDQGIEAGYRWLINNAAGTTLQNDNVANGYLSANPGTDPVWSDPNSGVWAQSLCLNGCVADANGNKTYYIIHRMCTEPNTPYNGTGASGVPNQCALTMPTTPSQEGDSMSIGGFAFQGGGQLYYRITSKVIGPQNSISIVQALVAMST